MKSDTAGTCWGRIHINFKRAKDLQVTIYLYDDILNLFEKVRIQPSAAKAGNCWGRLKQRQISSVDDAKQRKHGWFCRGGTSV